MSCPDLPPYRHYTCGLTGPPASPSRETVFHYRTIGTIQMLPGYVSRKGSGLGRICTHYREDKSLLPVCIGSKPESRKQDSNLHMPRIYSAPGQPDCPIPSSLFYGGLDTPTPLAFTFKPAPHTGTCLHSHCVQWYVGIGESSLNVEWRARTSNVCLNRATFYQLN
jgi:hypothetical protein